MITLENFPSVLEALDFIKTGDVYSKHFEKSGCDLKADFKNKKLIYPDQVKIHRQTTTNFAEPENFVVFECAARLFEKGYKADDIELEKPVPGGHADSESGYADIMVNKANEKGEKETFIIIECKNSDEFERFWHITENGRSQLFNYFNTFQSAKWLCMYTSDFDDGKVFYRSNIISMQDNEEYLATDKNLVPYKSVLGKDNAGEQCYNVWQKTYNGDFTTKGIFESDIEPYNPGKIKYSLHDLVEVGNSDIQKKYNEFATILRQHNVSGHENAFDKLVNLFLAKIVDETNNPYDLHFYWKGTAYDDDFRLQDRLQRLYRDGMKKFLDEDVTYIEESDIDKAFKFVKNDPDATKATIIKYFRQLKFFSNNDFAFIEVHNENLFRQNAVVLKKVVQMIEDIRLKTEKQNQFLGDLFEGFLDSGVKQSEGQFFTPLPIVRFLVSSLPLENLIEKSEEIPLCIDYACGAGHFLNEYAMEITPFVKKHKKADIKEYFEAITGIEKEYRLSKVAKVSAFMYGEDEIKIIYADALSKKSGVKDGTFSVLIANPPYSVRGFLETLSEEDKNHFELSKYAGENSNAIETFFVERAAQLLCGGGIAAIILPSSILLNGNIYVNCREILLRNFKIVAIAEFGSGTFGKTATNTVALFLEKRDGNPSEADLFKERVDDFFNGESRNRKKDEVYSDIKIVEDYCAHQKISLEDYKTLMDFSPSEKLLKTPLFEEYLESFEKSAQAKNIAKKKITGKYSENDKKAEFKKAQTDFIRQIEKEKLYYFMLASSNGRNVVIVKSPVENKSAKQFLGYEWSGRKGNEGIKYLNVQTEKAKDGEETDDTIVQQKGIDSIKTPLFNPQNLDDTQKINFVIRNNFLNGGQNDKEESRHAEQPNCHAELVSASLSQYITVNNLCDMIDFSRATFDKAIKANGKLTIDNGELKSKFPTKSVENLLVQIEGNKTKIEQNEIKKSGKFPVITQESEKLISGYTDENDAITDLPLIVFGDHSCAFKYVDFPFVRGADGTQLLKTNQDEVITKYFYHYFCSIQIENSSRYERHFKYLKTTKIPLPPLSVQQKSSSEFPSSKKKS